MCRAINVKKSILKRGAIGTAGAGGAEEERAERPQPVHQTRPEGINFYRKITTPVSCDDSLKCLAIVSVSFELLVALIIIYRLVSVVRVFRQRRSAVPPATVLRRS